MDRERLALRQREAAGMGKAKAHADAAVRSKTRHSIGYHSAKAQQALKVAARRGARAKRLEGGR